MIEISLYDGELVYLGAFKPDQDAPIESGWSYDPVYAYYLNNRGKPLSPDDVNKRYEQFIKLSENGGKTFFFMVKSNLDSRLLGFMLFDQIAWSHGSADFTFVIGERSIPIDHIQEALHLGLVYAFLELNLFRLTMKVPGFDLFTIQFLEQSNFRREVSQREALYFENQRWDLHYYGILKEDWENGGWNG